MVSLSWRGILFGVYSSIFLDQEYHSCFVPSEHVLFTRGAGWLRSMSRGVQMTDRYQTDFRVSPWAAEGLLYGIMFTKAAWRRLFKQQWFEPCS